jgi:TolB protein
VWSPEGTEIALIRCGETGLGECAILAVSTKLEGARPRRVTKDGLYGQPVWSPDGKRIALASLKDGIVVVAADGGGVLWSTREPDSDPSWSPDGRRLAFIRKGSVYVIAADGTGARRISDGKTSASSPAWSPAGDRIVFTQSAAGDAVECPSSALFAAEPDGSELLQVTRYGPLNAEPAWSPDGRQIAFVRMDECGSEEGPILSLIDAEGENAPTIRPLARLISSPVPRPPYGVDFAWRPSP